MNELPHAPVCIAVFGGDVVLWKLLDEDGTQRFVLAVIRGGIGIQEELSAVGNIHGCTLKCEVVFSGIPS
jgi:hypothetical protein